MNPREKRGKMMVLLNRDQEMYLKLYEMSNRSARLPVDNPTTAFAGTEGSYAEEAVIRFFGEDSKRKGMASFENVIKSLIDGTADYGVLPIENSSTGSISEVYDLLSRYTCFIVGEVQIAVSHCLMALPGASIDGIKEVYSHEQGFSQSRTFLSEHPDWKCIPWHNTAVAAKMVADSDDLSYAAIASRRAAKIHGLTILAEDINTSGANTTRFVVVSRVPEKRENQNKISIAFCLPHEAGSLYNLLGIFEHHHLNLCKIESRPLADTKWEYMFYLDFIGNETDASMKEIITEVIASTRRFYFLGRYPMSE